MAWQELSGRGVLYSRTTSHMAPPPYREQLPLQIAVVDLEEGLRVLTCLLGPDSDTPLDSPVQLVVTEFDDGCFFAARPTAPQTPDGDS
jgi:uncharacterized OB-fold protein